MQASIYAGAWFAVCAVVVGWIWFNHNSPLTLLLAVGALALSGLIGFIGLRSTPTGQLVWDGQHWHWESTAYQAGIAEQEVLVAADFQNIVLLRIKNHANASLWLWAERSALPERWLDLRRAIYSPQRISAGPTGEA